MKQILIVLTILCCCAAKAQAPAETPMPAYAYCEIIGNHLPTLNGNEVLFDFGQSTEYWRNNWLRNDQDEKFIFNSNIEALNYMVGRGWEFVQAYTSGEKNESTHLLLRIQTSQLPQVLRQQLLSTPRTKGDRKIKE